ncbi:MAG: hypothetical protein WC511_01765 [Candidatus Pacearchaeota archaeon]
MKFLQDPSKTVHPFSRISSAPKLLRNKIEHILEFLQKEDVRGLVLQTLHLVGDAITLLPFKKESTIWKFFRGFAALFRFISGLVSLYAVKQKVDLQDIAPCMRKVYEHTGFYALCGFLINTGFKEVFLHKKAFLELLDDVKIYENTTPNLKEISTGEFLNIESIHDYLILGFWNNKNTAVTLTKEQITLYHPEVSGGYTPETDAYKFKQSLLNCTLAQLSKDVIELAGKDSFHLGYVQKMKYSPLVVPEWYDTDISTQLCKIANSALACGIKTGVVLYGSYGVSKSSSVNHLLSVFPDALKFRLSPESYADASSIFSGLAAKKIVILDDVDIQANSTKTEEVAGLLNFLDSNSYDLCILIVNDINSLHESIVRPGRCDIKIYCPPPDAKKIGDIFCSMFHKYGLDRLQNEWKLFEEIDYECVVNKILNSGKNSHALVNSCFMNMLRMKISLREAVEKTLLMENNAKRVVNS